MDPAGLSARPAGTAPGGEAFPLAVDRAAFCKAAADELPALLRAYGELTRLREALSPVRAAALSPAAGREALRRMAVCRRRMIGAACRLIGRTLGREACRRILGQGKPDGAACLRCCAALCRAAFETGEAPENGAFPEGGNGEQR